MVLYKHDCCHFVSVRILNAVGFCHYVFVKIEECIYFLVHYNLFVRCIGHLCSLVPRPCALVACSTCRGANFVLQATNTQGLGTRLVSLTTNHNMLVYEEVGTVEFLIHCTKYMCNFNFSCTN